MASRLQKYLFVNFNKSHYLYLMPLNTFFFHVSVGFTRLEEGPMAHKSCSIRSYNVIGSVASFGTFYTFTRVTHTRVITNIRKNYYSNLNYF
jgi:glycopeptide antibiotics resistance protein